MTAEFLITSLLVVIVPGPGVLFTLASGLNQGRRGAVVAAFACTVGTLPHLVGAVLGLTVLLQANAVVFALVKILGVLYLLYLAWKMLADSDPPAVNLSSSSYADHRIVSKGILVNLLNPKLSAFFSPFFPSSYRTEEKIRHGLR